MLASGTRPPSGVNGVVPAVDGAAARVGRNGREERGIGDAEADLLPFHVAAGDIARSTGRRRQRSQRIAPCLGPDAVVTPRERETPSPPRLPELLRFEPVIEPSV